MSKARYKENDQLDYTTLDGSKGIMQVSPGYITFVDDKKVAHIVLVGVQARKPKVEVPDGPTV